MMAENEINHIHSLGSRRTVGYTLEQLCKKNNKVIAAYADIGSRFGLINNRINGLEVGIAEQSLIGIISGLCHEGFIPYGIAYAPFLVMRAADQIRMSVGEMNLGMKLLGGSAGLISGNLGAASLALDDISVMRAIPNMRVLSPADCFEEMKMIEAVAEIDEPCYIRLTGGDAVPEVYSEDFSYSIDRAQIVYASGKDVVVYASGMQVSRSINAARILNNAGIRCTVVDMQTIKPLDRNMLDSLSAIHTVVSVEEHNIIGGLGSALAEYIASRTEQRLIRLGVKDNYPAPDTYDALVETCGLSDIQIANSIKKGLR